jgi:hypothetical protein
MISNIGVNKQRHTAARIYRRLVEEYDFKGSEFNIHQIVADVRKYSSKSSFAFIFKIGYQFQFDRGEVDIILQGRRTQRIFLFCTIKA